MEVGEGIGLLARILGWVRKLSQSNETPIVNNTINLYPPLISQNEIARHALTEQSSLTTKTTKRHQPSGSREQVDSELPSEVDSRSLDDYPVLPVEDMFAGMTPKERDRAFARELRRRIDETKDEK